MASRLFLAVALGLASAVALRTAPAGNATRAAEPAANASHAAKTVANPAKSSAKPAISAAEEAMGSQVRLLLEALGGSAKAESMASSAVGRPEPQPETARYSARTCRNLFAYKDTRDLCMKLQKVICGRNISMLIHNNTNATQMGNFSVIQQRLCVVPVMNISSSPVKVENGSNTTTTFCNAYVSNSAISIQHDKYYAVADPKPFVEHLKYLQCAQSQIPAGTRVTIYLGHHSMAKYVVGSENAIVMLGQYTLGEMEMGIKPATFKNEGYGRPILCSAFPTPHLAVEIYQRNWHVFSDAEHPKAIGYMECEKLALDHADSVHHPEILDFYDGEAYKGELEVAPTQTLFVIGALSPNKTSAEMQYTSYGFDNIHATKKKPKKFSPSRAQAQFKRHD